MDNLSHGAAQNAVPNPPHSTPRQHITLVPGDLSINAACPFGRLDTGDTDADFDMYAGPTLAYLVDGVPMLCIWARWYTNFSNRVVDQWSVGAKRGEGQYRSSNVPGIPMDVARVLADTTGSKQMRLAASHTGGTAGFVPLLPLLEQWDEPMLSGFTQTLLAAVKAEEPHWRAGKAEREMLEIKARSQGFENHLQSLRTPRSTASTCSTGRALLSQMPAAQVLNALRAAL